MGVPSSKPSSNEALKLCRERTRFIKQAIDSRYALSAAHLVYIQSLKKLGTALRRFVEAEISNDPRISTSELDRSPSRSSYASSSPPRVSQNLDSPVTASALAPRLTNISHMRTAGNPSVSVTVNPSSVHFVKEDEVGSSWDFFDPTDKCEDFPCQSSSKSLEVVPLVEKDFRSSCKEDGKRRLGVDKSLEAVIGIAWCELRGSNTGTCETDSEEVIAEREDASEFITHRAKNLLSSMKDIEYRFNRAADTGNEVSRLLETSKIRLRISTEITGKPTPCRFLSTFQDFCCNAEAVFKQESSKNMAKVVTWNCSISSLSSSSSSSSNVSPATAPKHGDVESDCEFVEEFCMISGSHSSTLDRLYAWEKKLYDEVKACESIRQAYDQKCAQLRHQFVRNSSSQIIDKTRAIVKDLHSQIRVGIQAVDSVSTRIEQMRDEELQPQLVELLQGLIRMWKAMLDTHHTQFINISLAYHVLSSKSPHNDSSNQALSHLQLEIDCFASSFVNLVEAHRSYIEALSSWIHKCILQTQEQPKGRRRPATSIHQSFSLPPIFILCKQWLDGTNCLPCDEVFDSIKSVASILHDSVISRRKEGSDEVEDAEAEKLCRNWGLDGLKTSLTRMFDRLVKFSEASLKAFQDVRQANETACNEYYCSNRE